ncbi:MAG: electron transfer flavoprotein subunit alpha [Bryobacteraceae bacterium]|nr:electron transfer flavoprotein subunit alpha [Bryobacteraceae bacterium]
MAIVLFLGHTEADGGLAKGALEALEAARGLGGELVVGLVGASVDAAAIGGCGAARFLAVTGAAFAVPRYASDAAAAEAIARAAGAEVIVAAQTSRWARALPGVAHRLGGAADSHVTSLSADGAAGRWYYRQRIEAVQRRSAKPWVVLLEGGCAPAYSGAPAAVSVESIEAPVSGLERTVVEGYRSAQTGEQTINPEAKVLFVAGAGWTKKQKDGQVRTGEAEELILGFVRKAKASLGSSKSLVDLSGEGHAVLPFLTHLHQVGQTGSTPRHAKGLATCCHGEEPHVVGWRFIQERRAVNLDGNCGWARGKADVLYVADAFEVMRKVNELLGAAAAGA